MTNDEKIRLVLETLGADNVRQATRAMRELEKATEDVGKASSQAAGKGGVNGTGVLQLAYLIDDLQYGVRGVMNNIPILAQSLGLGAGLAGAAGIAAVAIGTLLEKHPEWFKWNEKIKLSLAELIDAIKAEEEAVKRQKEEVEKLGKTNSDRVEDLIKLKNATEDLKAAEDQLAEDRKNRKAVEEADKNAGAIATEELAKQKDVVKSVITDAGLQGDLAKNLSASIAQNTPGVDDAAVYAEASAMAQKEAGPGAWAQLSPEAKANVTKQYTNRARSKLLTKRDDQIKQSTEQIFGGLINPANQAEMDRSMQGLDQFLPGVSRELRNVYQFDQESADFEAGNQRWRGGRTRAARRAAEREFAAGERAGAQMLPNQGVADEARIGQTVKERAEAEARATQEAAIRNQVLGMADPAQMAAARMYQASQFGPGRNRVLKQLQERDTNIYANALSERGMSPAAAQEAAQESIAGGNRQFAEFADATGKGLSTNLRAFEASKMFMERQQMTIEDINARLEMLIQQMNAGATELPNVRPPARARN